MARTARSIAVLPTTAEIARLSTKLFEQVSPDPANRLNAASAIHHGATLITFDTELAMTKLSVAVVG